MGDDPVAWRYGFPRPRPFCGELPSATLRGRGLDPGIPKLGKSSCARALSLLSFCPSIRLSRETGLPTRHLSQCSLHGRIEGAEKP
jgi:hypothetical protein